MARIYGIKKALPQYGAGEEQIKEIIGSGNLVEVIERMEAALDPGALRRILDSQGCTGGKEYLKRCEKIGGQIAGLPLGERVEHVNRLSAGAEKITLNADNTLTVTLTFGGGGKHGCACSAAVKSGVKASDLAAPDAGQVMPLSYCYCCAGASRRHLQLQLGVGLETKEIVSAPINCKGEKPCEFILEITE